MWASATLRNTLFIDIEFLLQMSINLETFRKSLTYSVTAAVSDIVKDLRELATLDRVSEARREYRER